MRFYTIEIPSISLPSHSMLYMFPAHADADTCKCMYTCLPHSTQVLGTRCATDETPPDWWRSSRGGKTYVDQTVRDDYNSVQRREWLEMALVDSIRKHGTDRKNFKKVLVGCCPKWSVAFEACMVSEMFESTLYNNGME